MSNDHLLEIISGIFTSVLGLISWFTRKLVRDMETKIKHSHDRIEETQKKNDDTYKERFKEVVKVTDILRTEASSVSKAVALLEKNTEILSVMSKNIDEKYKEKLEVLSKNTEAINQVLQKMAVVEEKVANFGKVILK